MLVIWSYPNHLFVLLARWISCTPNFVGSSAVCENCPVAIIPSSHPGLRAPPLTCCSYQSEAWRNAACKLRLIPPGLWKKGAILVVIDHSEGNLPVFLAHRLTSLSAHRALYNSRAPQWTQRVVLCILEKVVMLLRDDCRCSNPED